MSPLFLIRRKKYASGFTQRFGYVEPLDDDEKSPVVWIHCVSVGETNAAIPLIERLRAENPSHRFVVSTTTRTGQDLAKKLFSGQVERIFYFPYDWRFSVRRTLRRIKPQVILVLETEIWFNFFRESYKRRAKVFLVNGRLSEKSVKRYAWVKKTMKRVLHYLELALVQEHQDAKRLIQLGIRSSKVKVTGNLKYDQSVDAGDSELTAEIRERFKINEKAPLIVAASTHEPEEQIVLEAFKRVWKNSKDKLPRLLIAPRHPERFDTVEQTVRKTGFDWAKRTEDESNRDGVAEVILLDTVGELRAVYPLAEIVFVGGSLIPHGGQSILEPAFARNAIVTGAHTENFSSAVTEFLKHDAIGQLPELSEEESVDVLAEVFSELLEDEDVREKMAENALVAAGKNGGATAKTIEFLRPYLKVKKRMKVKVQ